MSSTPALSLDSIAAEINREHQAAQEHRAIVVEHRISALERARNAGELLLQAEQRKCQRLERDKAIQAKEIERLLGQVEALQERIAIMEEHG